MKNLSLKQFKILPHMKEMDDLTQQCLECEQVSLHP